MAFKRGSRSVRFNNVANNHIVGTSSTSSDSESGGANKVRKRFSTKRLMRDSECYKVDYDHIYSAVSSRETNKKRKMTEISKETNGKPLKTRCFSKNAIMARLNRERKKVYVSTLESENDSLREQNRELNKQIEIQNKTIRSMKCEITYLKGLLANSKEIGQILKNLQNATSLPITSSLLPNCKDNDFVKPVISKSEDNFEESKPVRKANSLVKFPMIYEDINLGSTANKSFNYNETAEFENSLIKDDYNSFFHVDECEFNKNFICALEDPLSLRDSSFYSNACDPGFGICLHVNQKSISIEVCSICNGKANSCLSEHDMNSKILGT